TDGAMHIAYRKSHFYGSSVFQGIFRASNQLVIEGFLQSMILCLYAMACHASGQWRIVENRRKINPACFPVINCWLHVKHVNSSDHFVHFAEAQLRHVLPDLFSNEEEKIDHVLRLTGEFLEQLWVLGRNAD